MTARPDLKSGGIHRKLHGDGTGLDARRPCLGSGQGIHRKRPDIKRGGRGVQSQSIVGAPSLWQARPGLAEGGRGVHQKGLSQQIPDIAGDSGASGRGTHAKYTSNLYEYFDALSNRLRRVRVCCGEWHRILGPSPTIHVGTTAVFLDPPYGDATRDKVYNHDSLELAGAVLKWCVEHGDEPKLRIALCGYEGEHNELEELGWDKIEWKASGGYGARNKANTNASKERIWFSPHCLKQKGLFDAPSDSEAQ